MRELKDERKRHALSKEQKRDLDRVELQLFNVRGQMIQYKNMGKLPEFFKDVCHLDKKKLIEFCAQLEITDSEMFASGSPSYRSMCDLIIQKRPDLFRQGVSWNYWSLVASSIILFYTSNLLQPEVCLV